MPFEGVDSAVEPLMVHRRALTKRLQAATGHRDRIGILVEAVEHHIGAIIENRNRVPSSAQGRIDDHAGRYLGERADDLGEEDGVMGELRRLR